MSRLSNDERRELPNKIVSHFDKYCEIINPVPFDFMKDVYIPSLGDHWEHIRILSESKQRHVILNLGYSFDLYVDAKKPGMSKSMRKYVTFHFDDDKARYPNIDVDVYELSPATQDTVLKWANKAYTLRKLRQRFWQRMDDLLDHGWDVRKAWDSYRGNYRGGPTSGQGVNTAGQLVRLWPELHPFLPSEMRHSVRGAQVKSRLPTYIWNRGNPEQFRLRERPYHNYEYNEDSRTIEQDKPFTDEEWQLAKRELDATNHILTQMSLMKDVPRVPNYPTLCGVHK